MRTTKKNNISYSQFIFFLYLCDAMRILIVNTSEQTGGAAVAASRLCDALNNNGVKAKMMVRDKQTDDITVVTCGGGKLKQKWCFLWERFVIWLNNRFSRQDLFKVSIANAGIDITDTPEFKEADVIHLHWVNQGLLSLQGLQKILKSGKPVVWTMHDMWPMTAICHHAYDCEAYGTSCGDCHFLRRPGKNDLSARVFRKKQDILNTALTSHPSPATSQPSPLTSHPSPATSQPSPATSHPSPATPHPSPATIQPSPLHFVAVSEWLAEKARRSALIGQFPISVIPNVLSLQQFTIVDRTDARTALEINARYVIAFGAARLDDPIKGFGYLTEALRRLAASPSLPGGTHKTPMTHSTLSEEGIHLLLFGNVRDASIFDSMPVPYTYTYLGYISDTYRLSEVYSAANIVVSSSLYETFGQTLIEAMACGCVPVSFDGSGQTDIITHEKNGYLARRLSAESLAEGMEWALKKSESEGMALRKELRRSVVRRYGESVVANQYVNLYSTMANKQ